MGRVAALFTTERDRRGTSEQIRELEPKLVNDIENENDKSSAITLAHVTCASFRIYPQYLQRPIILPIGRNRIYTSAVPLGYTQTLARNRWHKTPDENR